MLINPRFQQAYQIMQNSARVLILGHLRPDGDALSAVCALGLIVTNLGKEVSLFCQDKNQTLFDYLPGFTDILADKADLLRLTSAGSLKNNFDLIIVADCGSLARTGLVEEILAFKKQGGLIIEFDHHPQIDNYADLELRQPELSSTAELVYNFIASNRIVLTRELADCILTGILTDTGNFLYPSASDATMQAASAAMEAGAHYAKIVNYTLRNKDVAMIKLWGLALERLYLNARYQVAISVLTRADIVNSLDTANMDNAAESDLLSGLAGFLSNLAGAKAVALLYEDRNGVVKGSLRSTPDGFLVSDLARALGGGGHERAAGFALPGRLEQRGVNWVVIN